MREQAVMRLVVVSNHHNAPSSHTSSFTHKSTKEKQQWQHDDEERPTDATVRERRHPRVRKRGLRNQQIESHTFPSSRESLSRTSAAMNGRDDHRRREGASSLLRDIP